MEKLKPKLFSVMKTYTREQFVKDVVNLEDEESLGYFQRVLRQSGIIDRLEEMGINEGDTVSILNFEFDYIR